MPKKEIYKLNQSVYIGRRKSFRRHLLALALFVLLLFLGLGVILIYTLHLNKSNNTKPVTATRIRSIAPQSHVYKTAYFQFTDSDTWQFLPNNSTANRFVFGKFNKNILEHDLTVYVNQVPGQIDLMATHTLPVTIVNGNSFTVGDVSGHCLSAYAPGAPMRVLQVKIAGTTMLCQPDSPQYTVVFGQVGGGTTLTLKRANGSTANYVIIYHNHMIYPSPIVVEAISKTFKAL